MVASCYDRSKESKYTKTRKSSIEWVIKSAIKNSEKTPDIIFHKGDVGKEPMIIVFGENPKDVLSKVLKMV